MEKWIEYILNHKLLDHEDIIQVAPFSVSGKEVGINDKVSWSRLWDSSVCLIDYSDTVSVPYATFHIVAIWNISDFNDDKIQAFVLTLRSLIKKVDSILYDKVPWQLWEVFGAHFHV